MGLETWTGLPSKVLSPASKEWMPAIPLIRVRLAGSVVADQRGDPAGADVEVDAAQHVDGSEALVDAAQAEQGLGGGGCGL